jgi:hypothetical protein
MSTCTAKKFLTGELAGPWNKFVVKTLLKLENNSFWEILCLWATVSSWNYEQHYGLAHLSSGQVSINLSRLSRMKLERITFSNFRIRSLKQSGQHDRLRLWRSQINVLSTFTFSLNLCKHNPFNRQWFCIWLLFIHGLKFHWRCSAC